MPPRVFALILISVIAAGGLTALAIATLSPGVLAVALPVLLAVALLARLGWRRN